DCDIGMARFVVAIFGQDDRELRPPLLRPGEPLALLFRRAFGCGRDQRRDDVLEVGADRQVRLYRWLLELDRVDVDPGLEGLAREALPVVADLADVEPAAENQKEVGALRHHVAAAVADRARPTAIER